MRTRQYYTYIMASRSQVLYIGMTNDLERRVWEHKHGNVPGFTKQYRVTRLVYYEAYGRPIHAIEREKQLKGWRREKKIALIEAENPRWLDLSAGWFEVEEEERGGAGAAAPS
jgi:putative endonuclease